MMRSVCVALMAIAIFSCRGDRDGPAQGTDVCDAIEACQGAGGRMECEMVFGIAEVSDSCLAAVEAAPCEEHAKPEPNYVDECFPPCDLASVTCDDDGKVTKCEEFGGGERRQISLRCSDVCETEHLMFTGVCGKTHDGRTSEEDVCWCE